MSLLDAVWVKLLNEGTDTALDDMALSKARAVVEVIVEMVVEVTSD